MKKSKIILTLVSALIVGVLGLLLSNVSFAAAQAAPVNSNAVPADYVDHSNDGLRTMLDSLSSKSIQISPAMATLAPVTTYTTTKTKVDIVFVVDTTGSMYQYMTNVKNNISAFAQHLNNLGITLRLGIVEYRDTNVDGMDSTVVHTLNNSPWMDLNGFIDTLTKMSADGGGDIPEMPLDALGYLVDGKTMLWSSDAHKFAVLLTDAPYWNSNRWGYNNLSEVADQLAAQKINTSVITYPNTYYDYDMGRNVNCYDEYRVLTTKTGGVLDNILTDNFANVLQNLADSVLNVTNQHKQAIYVLPGFMGSRLYDANDKEIWVDTDALKNDVKAWAKPGGFGGDSILVMDLDGTGSQVGARIGLDKYGSQDEYKTLVNGLQSKFGSEYDIVFFPYNWLNDLNYSAQLLTQHINSRGYDKVVFVTHSTGGLLASTYIAQNKTNQLKVKKAILIAAPLFGTYTSLEPIEYGKTADLDKMLSKNGLENDLLGVTYDVAHSWIAAISKNAPCLYQLLPSLEYLKLMPQLYQADFAGKSAVVTTDEYYKILNGSSSINPNLTNGNSRSHQTFRNTTLSGNITKVLQKVDTTLVGSGFGNSTPAIAVYGNKLLGGTKIQDIIYKKNGDGTVLNASAWALTQNNGHILNFKNFDNLSHGDLDKNTAVLNYIYNIIGEPSSSDIVRSSASFAPVAATAAVVDQGMSSLIKLNITADQVVDIDIKDASGQIVASVKDGMPDGFDNNNFIYTALDISGDKTDAIVYIPNGGYSVAFSYGTDQDSPVNLQVDVSTLDYEGYKTATASYASPITGTNGSILMLNMLDGVDADNLESLSDGATATLTTNHTDWEIEPQKVLSSIGATDTIKLSGSDVDNSRFKPTDLTWESSDPSVVTVDQNGEITAVDHGQATIYATAKDGSYKSQPCNVTVQLFAKTVSFDNVNLVTDERYVITPTFDSPKVTQITISYAFDSDVISIDSGGVITALKPGVVKVTGTAEGGAKNSFTVTVSNDGVVAVQSVSITPAVAAISVGEEMSLQANLNPSNATNQNLQWFTDDDSPFTIIKAADGTCVIKGVKEGTADLTVVTQDGGYVAKTTITVSKNLIQNSIKISGVDVPIVTVGGVATLELDKDTLSAILNVPWDNITIDLSGFNAVDLIMPDVTWLKDYNKTLTLITATGSFNLKTKTIWNNSGKTRLVSIRGFQLSITNQ